MATAKNKRISHGLTLPHLGDGRDSVVNNILSSLATLDETAQMQWIQETSRQVDLERAYQRQQENGAPWSYDRYDENDESTLHMPVAGVGYRERGTWTASALPFVNPAAPSPAIAMGRSSKGGFFRRFMGIGPKIPVENDLMISTQQPNHKPKLVSSVQVVIPLCPELTFLGARDQRSHYVTSNYLTTQHRRLTSWVDQEKIF
jgi:hypothetical protein